MIIPWLRKRRRVERLVVEKVQDESGRRREGSREELEKLAGLLVKP
jgi:hypothetical protein